MAEILVALAVDSVLVLVLIIATVRFIDWCDRRGAGSSPSGARA